MTPNSNASLLGALSLAASAVVVYSFGWDSNETNPGSEESDSNIQVPLPGVDWLDRIATPDSGFLWEGSLYSSVYMALMEGEPLGYPCRNLNAWLNSIIFSPKVAASIVNFVGSIHAGHYLLCYLRNLLAGSILYYVVAGAFHYFCYVHPQSKDTFEKQERTRPSAAIMWDQIKLAQASLFLYVTLPVVDEWMIENNLTFAYFTIEEIGGFVPYVLYSILYFALVEIGIYWMHRTLHTNKFLYKHVHMLHHKYNKPETLTPWASIAFHPLDGLLQACPYTLVLALVPCHYPTHFIMLFNTAVWATYIHDAMDWNVDPIMGAKYHTVHHTHYIYNYGQIFTFCDRFWGTYKLPDGPTGVKKAFRGSSVMSGKNKKVD